MIGSLIVLSMTQSASAQMTVPCHMLTEAVAEGAVIDETNTAPVACPTNKSGAKLRYDRHGGVVRARHAMPVGEVIGRAYLPQRPEIFAGSAVNVTARLGRVSVTRQVVALQAVRTGERFFVRGDDGKIFRAPPLQEASE